jgi:hypothetical protein
MHIREIPVIEYRRWLASLAAPETHTAPTRAADGAPADR